MPIHFEELDCDYCGKLYRIGWNMPLRSDITEVVPVSISHCPLGEPIRAVGLDVFEEMLDGQWFSVEPYVHKNQVDAA